MDRQKLYNHCLTMSLELEQHRRFGLKPDGVIVERVRHALLFAIVCKALLGQKRLDPARLFERGLFAGEIRIQEIELIPKEGPLLVVANHDNTDLLKGGVQIASISYAVSLARGENGYVHWIQAAGPKDSLFQWALPLAKEAYGLISKCFGSILVDRDGGKKHKDAGRKMHEIWKKGGIVGLFPEGDAGPRLGEINPKAEKFLRFCQRIPEQTDLQIVPIAGWVEHGIVQIKVGQPLNPKQIQNIGGLVMQAIENLLPPEKNANPLPPRR